MTALARLDDGEYQENGDRKVFLWILTIYDAST